MARVLVQGQTSQYFVRHPIHFLYLFTLILSSSPTSHFFAVNCFIEAKLTGKGTNTKYSIVFHKVSIPWHINT